MSTRTRRHNGPNPYSSPSRSAISGVTVLLIFCLVKCISDAVRARNRPNRPFYETDTTESERDFEPYIPRRERRERRTHQGRANRARWSSESVLDDRERDYREDNLQTRTRTQPRIPSSIRLGPDQRPLPAGLATGVPGSFECQICFDEKSREDFPARRMTKQCKHEPTDCCNTCLAQAIRTAFEGNMWDDIRCPICNKQLQFQDMAELAPRNVFERYDTFHLRRAVERDLPNFRWCIDHHCSYGEEHPDDPSPVIECSACGSLACSHHNVPWHHGESCSEYDRRIASRQARAEYKSEKAIKRVAKRCPGCRRFINKNGGCNHMTCLCGRQFCWTCLHDHPGHESTCPHHLG